MPCHYCRLTIGLHRDRFSIMSELPNVPSRTISEEDAAKRWEQGLALFTTFTQIWMSNPELAKQAGCRVEELVKPLDEVRKRHANDLL